MKLLHVLVVDDEDLARRAVVRAVEQRPETGRVTECASGADAIRRIRVGDVDLVFLDVRMPEIDGFEVVRRIGGDGMPPVVFITAYDRFAVTAFEVRAIDYLLKPFTRRRFEESFARALESIANRSDGGGGERFGGLLGTSEPVLPDRFRIRTAGRTTVVQLDDVIWIEASNTYVRIHTNDKTHLLRASIGALEKQLDPARFIRVHRSAIVKLTHIVQMRHIARGDYELVLSNGTCVRATRRRRHELAVRLKKRAF